MDVKTLKKMLESKLGRPSWTLAYDKEKEQMRIEDKETKKGITLSLSGLAAKYGERKDSLLEEVVHHVEETMQVMHEDHQLVGKESQIYPVIRSTSFPEESKEGTPLIFEEHTAETRIYFALDLGDSYRLIDKDLLERENWTRTRLKEMALFNLRSLKVKLKEDTVAGNTFYFLNTNDGYDASRILNQSLIEKMADEARGQLAVAVPHQDVLIFGDIRNDQGFDILAQMTMHFFTNGLVPITALPFLFENNKLEPVFIMAKNKPTKE
ncbi:DUF1444 domain-containing protein [Pseudalkalibacillus caeni]|uniref:UPF0354 protein FCL54_01835 n=1 Tax=Exobacillus caeni TaxID=2574798 RepID=A0A5R9FER4_9BACL|nr:DUF1444 domain-containing protein [Pseudalkalibacillus caeni]TLS39074.1 DUF1444 domain-containing protein [Pseudalkalibacillus caeni]